MENINELKVVEDANTSQPVATGEHQFSPWMTVQEAVIYCMSKGLPRTAKTVRKWAQRSVEAIEGSGEIAVQRQDTENGFRWLIGRESLDVKIEQEKELILRNEEEHEGTKSSEPVRTGVNLFEQVGTGAHMFTPPVNELATEPMRLHHTSEPKQPPVHTEGSEIISLLKNQLQRAEHQLDVKDKQIDALLERDRETNILIQGLQTSLTGVVNALPSGRPEDRHEPHRYPSHQLEQGSPTRDA